MAAFGMEVLPKEKQNNNIEHSVQIMNGQIGDSSSADPTVQQHMTSKKFGSCTNHSVTIQNC